MNAAKLSVSDKAHPDILLKLSAPIALPLFVAGSFSPEDNNAIAIVGTRQPTAYGIRMAKAVASQAVARKQTVVSGLARGIDTIAHQETLAHGGRTIAVLGSGIDTVYPAENSELADKIAETGAVVSQFPLHTPPLRKNFPLRNTTVVKLVSMVVLVEAGERSGSLITARKALKEGKRVLVIPGPLDAPSFAGNWAFFSKYASNPLVSLASSTTFFSSDSRTKQTSLFTTHQTPVSESSLSTQDIPASYQALFSAIHSSGNAISLDELAEKLGVPGISLSAGLLELEIMGAIQSIGSSYRSLL